MTRSPRVRNITGFMGPVCKSKCPEFIWFFKKIIWQTCRLAPLFTQDPLNLTAGILVLLGQVPGKQGVHSLVEVSFLKKPAEQLSQFCLPAPLQETKNLRTEIRNDPS